MSLTSSLFNHCELKKYFEQLIGTIKARADLRNSLRKMEQIGSFLSGCFLRIA